MSVQLVSLAFAAAVFLVITALLSKAGHRADHRQKRLQDVKQALVPDQKKGMLPSRRKHKSLKQMLQRMAQNRHSDKKKTDKKTAKLEAQLEMAGLPISAGAFSALKLMIALVLCAAVYLVTPLFSLNSDLILLCYAAALAAGLLIPSQLVKSGIARKKTAYLEELPDVMDLLSVSVEAGLGFDAALNRLYEKNKSPLMQEFMRAQRDVHHGISKKVAYTAMASRCDLKELSAFISAMLQAEELGVSIRSVLKSQAQTLREDRRQRAEEKALKAPVTMLLPMVLFIFPVIFIVLLGPALMNVMELL